MVKNTCQNYGANLSTIGLWKNKEYNNNFL